MNANIIHKSFSSLGGITRYKLEMPTAIFILELEGKPSEFLEKIAEGDLNIEFYQPKSETEPEEFLGHLERGFHNQAIKLFVQSFTN